MAPLVTIVIPTYNRAHLVSRAITSALAQTYQNIEVLVVDDGSTDDTVKVVKGFSDPRLQYIRQDKNRGVCAARNVGIRKSRGEYIAFLDSDDEYLPQKIEKSVEVFRGSPNNLGVVTTNFWRVANGKKHLGVSKRTPWILFGMYSRAAIEAIGFFDESFEFLSDLDYGTRLFCSSFTKKMIDEPLLVYYLTKGSICTDFRMERSIEIKKRVLEKCAPAMAKGLSREARHAVARVNYFLGKDMLHIGRPAEAPRYFWRAFLLHPTKIEYLGKVVSSRLKRRAKQT